MCKIADRYICQFPHVIKSSILIFDYELFKKYEMSEIDLPTYCICGDILTYEKPMRIDYIDRAESTESNTITIESILFLEKPLGWVTFKA